jgi:phosphate transport system ATP-binding protein
MDEPWALDPITTRWIEELMQELEGQYTIAIVTHDLQQAKRVADMTPFLYVDTSHGGHTGHMVEYGPTTALFEDPQETYTREYASGQFG